jgi:arabinogalactan endo-1,4-beta-galactosidase
MKKGWWVYCSLILLIFACSNKAGTPQPQPDIYKPPVVSSTFAKGADISWVTQMESSGVKFYDKAGKQQDLFALMCNTADLVVKALRAKNAGMKIMIDFHYSDSWADPGKQFKPAAWTSLNFATLTSTLHDYTASVMNTLKTNGITPDWAQVGNETNDGMLWEDGRASKNMANFAALVKAGYSAVKSVSSTTKVIVHISNGYDNSLFRWMFDGLKANGAQWDIIGMSLYPSTDNWATLNSQCLANINDMVARYSTPCMVVEVGMNASATTTARSFLSDIITKTNAVASGNGLGVFYWEPEAYNWQGYGLGAFDNNGKPTIALDAFGN